MPTYSRPWEDNPLEYLVRVRFPLEQRYKAAVPGLGIRTSMVRDEAYLEEASDYRGELQQLPEAELRERAQATAKEEFQKALAKSRAEEEQRFFNQPSANTDVVHWARMSLWTTEETVALSLGKDPRRVNWENVRSLIQVSSFAAAYQARRDIILRAKQAGQLWEATIPGVFIAWAERMNIDLSLPLVDAVKNLGIQVADWKSAYEAQKKLAEEVTDALLAEKEAGIRKTTEYTAFIKKMRTEQSDLINSYRERIAALEKVARPGTGLAPIPQESVLPAREKYLGARERESLLKLVIGMAVEGYRYKANATRSEIISEIAGDLEKAGVALDVDTVRKYIYEARDLLPPPETEQKS